MRLPLALLAMLLLAGCAEDAAPAGPVELPDDQLGVLLLDLPARHPVALTQTPGTAWMAPRGEILVWHEGEFDVLSNRTLQSVQPAPRQPWARIEDDVTGVVLEPGQALRKLLTNGTTLISTPLPAGPRPDGTWSGASADLRVLVAEWEGVTGGRGTCDHPLVIHDVASGENVTRTGCHLRVARDGRVGWTEATGVWVRETNGTIRDVTGTGREVDGRFVAHENPVFTADGFLYLRLTGNERLASTEILDDQGAVLARLEGEHQVALHDVSADGKVLLLSIFER